MTLPYPIISRIAAAVLFASGVSKLVGGTSGWTTALAGGELIGAVWLTVGMYPVVTRVLTIGLFLVFFNVVLARAVAGYSSCGCFGKVSVSPWLMAGVDAVLVIAMAASRPRTVASSPMWRSASMGIATAVGLVGVGAFVFNIATSNRGIPKPGAINENQRRLIDRVKAGIAENTARYSRLDLVVDKVYRDNTVDKPQTIRTVDASGGVTEATFTPEGRSTCRVQTAGRSVKNETVSPATAFGVLVQHDGREVEHAVASKTAWIRDIQSSSNEPADVRCVGFDAPLSDLCDWFARVRISRVSEYHEKMGNGIVVAAKTAHEEDVEVWFSEARSYLPVRKQSYLPNGVLAGVNEFEYQSVGPAWVIKRFWSQGWANGRQAAEQQPTGTYEVTVRDGIKVDAPQPPDLYDYQIPAGTTVHRNFTAGGPAIETDRGARVSELHAQAVAVRSSRRGGTNWPLVTFANVGLLGACRLIARRPMT